MMKKLFKSYYSSIICSCLLVPALVQGQEKTETTGQDIPGRIENLPIYRPWMHSNNAAALNLSDIYAAGQTSVGVSAEKGSFRMSQQPETRQQLNFLSEGYKPLKKMMFYGKFQFTQQKDKNLNWTDVMDPYRGDPYIIADSIGGDWTKQLYELQLKVATPKFLNDKILAGIGIDYKVSTGARQRDPRPLNTVNEWELKPAFTWQINKNNTVGIDGALGSYKEEISFDRKNTTLNHNLYYLLGMGYYRQAIFSGSATRNYKGNKYGGDIQYAFNSGKWQWLTEAGYRFYTEEVTDGTSRPNKMGKIDRDEVAVNSVVIFRSRYAHKVGINYERKTTTGTEYHNWNNREKDAWEVILEAPFTTIEINKAALSYDFIIPAEGDNNKWLFNGTVTYNGLENRYLYPQSKQKVNTMSYTVSATRNWFWDNGNALNAGLGVTRNKCTSKELDYTEMKESTNIIAHHVFYPDNAYLTSDSWQGNAYARYDFHLNAKNILFYVKGEGVLQARSGKAPDVSYAPNGRRGFAQLSIGVFY